MPNLINLPPFNEDGDVYVVVETPRGSRAKFDYDPKLKTFTLSKIARCRQRVTATRSRVR
jgi:inorganic pyrophosphatase